MIITPSLISVASPFSNLVLKLPFLRKFKRDFKIINTDSMEMFKNHIIIIGFGINGRNIAVVAKKSKIPYIIIEMNPITVLEEKKKGEPIFFGDGSQEEVLKHAQVDNARVVVVTIPDASSVRRITHLVHNINNNVFILVRTRYVSEIKDLYKLGASDVIAEEFETSLIIFNKVLEIYKLTDEEIKTLLSTIRSNSYSTLCKWDKVAK